MSLLVVVCCYQGDAHQVKNNWPSYVQHKVPVLILSPEDSPVLFPGVESRVGGKRAYTGFESLDRQWIHLNILNEYPYDRFLVHDADSVCLSPRLPDYLLLDEGCNLWSSPTALECHPENPEFYYAGNPPYFFSRNTLGKLISKDIPRNPSTPASVEAVTGAINWSKMAPIDWYMDALCDQNGVAKRATAEGTSCPAYVPRHREILLNEVNRGKYFLHTVKTREVFDDLCRARTEYLATGTLTS